MTAINVVWPPREMHWNNCTELYGFVQHPSLKFVPKNCLKICTKAAILFLDFCAKISTVIILDFHAQISASNSVLNASILFLDFHASLSWKQCLSPTVWICALGFVPITLLYGFVEVFLLLPSLFSLLRNVSLLSLLFSQSAHERLNDLLPLFLL